MRDQKVAAAYSEGTQFGSSEPQLLRRVVYGSVILSLCAFCLSMLIPFSDIPTARYLYGEDRWLLAAQTLLLLVACRSVAESKRQLRFSRSLLPLVALALLVVCYAGAKWILFGYELSRDEQMAVFDSRIFASGLLAQPLPPFWQVHASALNTKFMLPVAHPVAWVSSYLPINAALRALVGLVADPSLTGPLMVVVGLVALWKCARLLWPDDREAAIVAVLLYVGSAQVLFAGMTAYAMPAHLAFNLVWLWLFLLNRRGADLGALLVGFLATGLHQPLFHPLFAAPILFTLVCERNWPRVTLFATGYAAICAFWLAWPIWTHALVTGPHSTTLAGGTDYLSRTVLVLLGGDPNRWANMGANLLRFFAWEHVLLLPLLVAGIAVARTNRLACALAVSAMLPVCVMLLLLPYQGHGFGYRYVHGVIGAAVLVAVYGWRSVVADNGWLRPLVFRTTLAGIIVLLPLQAWMAYRLYAPFARIDRGIASSHADYFIAGGMDVPLVFNLVVNRPDVSNRPVRLLGDEIDDTLIHNICGPGVRVAMPTSNLLRPIEEYYHFVHSTKADERIANLSPRLIAAGCSVDRLDGP